MKNSLYIAKVSGIKIFIHWTFLILIFWVIAAGLRQGNDVREILFSIAFILTIFLCVVLHELGHALTAKRFNYITRDIILLPIGGMARMEELPEKPKQELLVAIAGPLVNVVIAGILYFFIDWESVDPNMIDRFSISENNFILSLYSVNIALVLFNLIPAFPMDGGRMLRALLSMRMSRVRATSLAARTGQVMAVIFCIVGFFFNPFLILIGIFIFITAQMEHQDVKSRFLLQRFTVKDVVSTNFPKLEQSARIKDAVTLLLDTQATDFLVTDQEKIVGTLNKNQIIEALSQKGESAQIAEVMNSNVKFITEDITLDILFKEFRSGKVTLMPVMRNGQLIGTVDLNNIMELILIETAVQEHARQQQLIQPS